MFATADSSGSELSKRNISVYFPLVEGSKFNPRFFSRACGIRMTCEIASNWLHRGPLVLTFTRSAGRVIIPVVRNGPKDFSSSGYVASAATRG